MAASTPSPPAIRACLFDMDGLLLNTEDIYTDCTNFVLRKFGKPDLPWNIKAQMQGRPAPTAGKILEDWAQLPISRGEYLDHVKEMQTKLFPNSKPLPGVEELLAKLGGAKTEGAGSEKVEMALATSSHSSNFKLKSSHLGHLFDVFPKDQQVLGDDPRIAPGRGKPAPDIYLLALQTINTRRAAQNLKPIAPAECLVFEDSVPGVESGRRAGMQVVWCPHPGLLNEYKGREDRVLAAQMGEFTPIDGSEVDGAATQDGKVGEIGDGWARLYGSLEAFPYKDYGIVV